MISQLGLFCAVLYFFFLVVYPGSFLFVFPILTSVFGSVGLIKGDRLVGKLSLLLGIFLFPLTLVLIVFHLFTWARK